MRRALLLALTLIGCVPNGPATTDAGSVTASPAAAKPRPVVPQPPSSSPSLAASSPPPVRGATGSVASPSLARPPSAPLGSSFEDNFERPTVGADWRVTPGGDWRIDKGRLCVKGAHNHGVWLARTLPTNVRIEFDALSDSPDGDIKAEIFGDGSSAASGQSYNDATSYLTIFGGWKNNFHVLARLNEHASDRPEIKITPGSDDERARPVNAGQVYHFKVERDDGRAISWWVGDMLMFKFTDPQPLLGPGHDHLGFNDWEVPVCFDNVKVVPL
jgi:hypothetical protein